MARPSQTPEVVLCMCARQTHHHTCRRHPPHLPRESKEGGGPALVCDGDTRS